MDIRTRNSRRGTSQARGSSLFGKSFGVSGGGEDSFRALLTNLLNDTNTVANYQPGIGVTGTLNASAWANQIGAAGSLLQATGANQPIYLPFDGTKYGWYSGVSGNYFDTPDAAANRILSDIGIMFYGALDDWTPAGFTSLVSKWVGADANSAFDLGVNLTTGTLSFVHVNGTTQTVVDSTVAPSISDGVAGYVLCTWKQSTGKVNFYKSTDEISWTQVGTADVAGPTSALNNSTRRLAVGATVGGTANLVTGKVYRVKLYNGIPAFIGGTGSNTPAVDFNPADSVETTTNAATFTSSTTGEVWTLNNTGAKLAQIVGSPQLLFDGSAYYMKTAPFAQAQPITGYMVLNPVTWALNDVLVDGNTATIELAEVIGTPTIGVPGGLTDTNVSSTLNAFGILTWIWNGASSLIQFNATSDTGTGPTTALDGLSLGASGIPAAFFNAQIKEFILRSGSDSAATRAQIQAYLKAIHGTP